MDEIMNDVVHFFSKRPFCILHISKTTNNQTCQCIEFADGCCTERGSRAITANRKTGANQGRFDTRMADALLTITGIFPQGYGIVFLPKPQQGQPVERYEFAIVKSLYPLQPEVPICRIVTRNLQFKHVGQNCTDGIKSFIRSTDINQARII